VVLAVAALHQLLRVRVVATAAAHQVAAIAAERGFVALPEIRPKKGKTLDNLFWFYNYTFRLQQEEEKGETCLAEQPAKIFSVVSCLKNNVFHKYFARSTQ